MASNPPYSPFDRVHDSLYVYSPDPLILKNQASDPDTILFLAWGNAPFRNILKYTAEYEKIFPSARIVLFLTTFADIVLHTPERQAEPLSPAVHVIRAAGDDSRTLVHLFSNGGSYKLRELALAYKRTTGKVMPMDLLILDSAPGLPDFWRGIVAFQTQLPKFVVFHYIGTFLIYCFMSAQHVLGILTGRKPIIDEVWEALNNPQLIDLKGKRLYMFSKTDELIDWHDIRLHGGSAKREGYSVKYIEFTGSKHVAHVMVDKEKYWDGIRQAWEDSQGATEAS